MRKLIIWSVAVLAVTASVSVANAVGSREKLLTIGFSHGTGDYAGAFGGDYLGANGSGASVQIPEIGGGAEFGFKFSEDYSVVFGGDYRAGSDKFEPTNATTGNPTLKVTSSSWKLRLGGDRVGKIGDRFTWFMGPGLEYGSGKAKFEPGISTTASQETEPTTLFGLNGRVGGIMMMNPKFGIRGQIGDSFGQQSVKENGGKNTAWYSSFEALWGVTFALGE
jgi:hypothetical protein